MQKKLIAGNWKMNGDREFVKKFFNTLNSNSLENDVWIATPATLIETARKHADVSIKIGAQNVYPGKSGAFTGEIAACMAKDAGASFVLVGHSERRTLFSDAPLIAKKISAILEEGLIPILCVGESLEQRESHREKEVIQRQLQEAEISSDKIIIAYEPVWAIGTGKTATPQMASAMHRVIREALGRECTVLYGGSVTPANIAAIMAEEGIDGVLVGGSSLTAEDFIKIINYGR